MPATIHLIAGARPNFMKVAPLYHRLSDEAWCRPVLVHTGQHYDAAMSDAFFADLGLPAPDHHLGVGSGSHAEQTAKVMLGYEALCRERAPDWVVVVGDVNSTMACTLAAKKLGLPVAHLEAGLRSGDRGMPEEINRVVTDALADLLWTPSRDADDNLRREGRPDEAIEFVGNIMIDCLEMLRPQLAAMPGAGRFGVAAPYGVVTLHRPSNVDRKEPLAALVDGLLKASATLPLIFPVHPRTRAALERFGLADRLASGPVTVCEPLGYLEFMSLVVGARLVITDSGGLQEETTYLGIPCLTLRRNTERPITVSQGTNRLIATSSLLDAVADALRGPAWVDCRIDLWDGQTAGRVTNSLMAMIRRRES